MDLSRATRRIALAILCVSSSLSPRLPVLTVVTPRILASCLIQAGLHTSSSLRLLRAPSCR